MKKSIDWKFVGIIAAAVLGIIILCVAVFAGANNRAIDLEEQVKASASQVKVLEKRRSDLLQNLVDTVQAASDYESSTLIRLTEARSMAQAGNNDEATTVLQAVAEAYPTLEANQDYLALMDELSLTENGIAQARKNFNEQVRAYNKHIRKFPNNIFLGFIGYEPIDAEYLEFNVSEDAPTNLFGD